MNFELQIAPFSHVSRVTRHGLWSLADFLSILLWPSITLLFERQPIVLDNLRAIHARALRRG